MAIGFDATSASASDTSTPVAWNHTCTGSDLILLVGISLRGSLSLGNCTGVTYNGTAMTLAGSKREVSTYQQSLWCLINPDTGTHQISASWTGSSQRANGGAISLTGAKQTDQPDNTNGSTSNPTSSPASATILPSADGCWVVGTGVISGTASLTESHTQRWETAGSTVFKSVGQDTNGSITPAANTTIQWSWSSGTRGWAITLASITPAINVALAGTITSSTTETDIITGGKTIILTLTGDTWVATVGEDNAITQAIIDGIDSAQSEATGWDAVVKANMIYTDVVRTSDTVVTITLGAEATYEITSGETITATIPSTALTGGVEIVATPTFTINPVVFGRNNLGCSGIGD